MTAFSVQGRGHHILSRLDASPTVSADLLHATGADTRKARAKAWRALMALKDADLIQVDEGLYFITQAGRDALACLRSGKPVVIEEARPTVRVFVERRVAA
jgi:hypothetical protein